MGPVLETLATLANPVRVSIVDRLADCKATVEELAAGFEMSFQAISQRRAVSVRDLEKMREVGTPRLAR